MAGWVTVGLASRQDVPYQALIAFTLDKKLDPQLQLDRKSLKRVSL